MSRSNLLRAAAVAAALSFASPAAADGDLVRIATVPSGAEVTGIAVNGLGELFFNSQHPAGKGELEAGGPAALIGYVDGININTFGGPGVAVPGKDMMDRVNVAGGEYVILGKIGDELGDGKKLGGVYDLKGNLMFVSNDVDFNAFIPLGANEAYLYTAFEGASRKGVSAISRLKLVRKAGKWTTDFSQSGMLDLSSIEGAWVLCYGTISPWGTPILAEEYYFYNTSLWNHPDNHDADERPSFLKGNDNMYHQPKMMNAYLGKPSNPYRYGYNIEMNGAASKDGVTFNRLYTLGRFSHENIAVMGDGKTLYQSDDDSAKYTNAKFNTNSGGVLFKFVADHKADLTSGTLYAAKVKQDATSDPRKAGFDVTWVKLAHGTNDQIAKWVAEYDGIKVSDYKEGGSNFISDADVNNWAEGKLGKDLNGDGKVGSYPDDRPAFLESRKAAAAMGATNEWNKLEGVTATPATFYMAISEIAETMDKQWGHVGWDTGKKDKAIAGDIAVDSEKCGAIYAAKIGADFDIRRLEPAVVGKLGEPGPERKGKPTVRCFSDNIANPDNILALSNGNLLIGEDAGDRMHPVDMLWLKRF